METQDGIRARKNLGFLEDTGIFFFRMSFSTEERLIELLDAASEAGI